LKKHFFVRQGFPMMPHMHAGAAGRAHLIDNRPGETTRGLRFLSAGMGSGGTGLVDTLAESTREEG
jgi:hypothetical protein